MVMRATLLLAGSSTGAGVKHLLLLEILIDELQFIFLVVVIFLALLVIFELALKSERTYIPIFHIIII
jgi:hypothetical protein